MLLPTFTVWHSMLHDLLIPMASLVRPRISDKAETISPDCKSNVQIFCAQGQHSHRSSSLESFHKTELSHLSLLVLPQHLQSEDHPGKHSECNLSTMHSPASHHGRTRPQPSCAVPGRSRQHCNVRHNDPPVSSSVILLFDAHTGYSTFDQYNS